MKGFPGLKKIRFQGFSRIHYREQKKKWLLAYVNIVKVKEYLITV